MHLKAIQKVMTELGEKQSQSAAVTINNAQQK